MVPPSSNHDVEADAVSNPVMRAFDPIPSFRRKVSVTVAPDLPSVGAAGAVAVPVDATRNAVAVSGFDRRALSAAGFDGKRGQCLVLPSTGGRVFVALGIGTGETVSAAFVRDLAADFARAVPHQLHLAVQIPSSPIALGPRDFGQAVTEGVLLARWRFYLGKGHEDSLLDSLIIAAPDEIADEVREGVRIGTALSRASNLGRDLANCPATTLSAERMAAVAGELGPDAGLEVEAFGKAQLTEMGCGGLLGVNLGSAEPPS